LHRAERRNPIDALRKRTNSEMLEAGMGTRLDELPELTGPGEPLSIDAVDAPAAPADHRTWLATRTAALAAAARPGTVSATALTDDGAPDPNAPLTLFDSVPAEAPTGDDDPGLQKRPRDLDLPPWLKGRYGTAVGRAVHGVLQTIDLATGQGLDAAVAVQCQAEAIPDRADDVRALVEAALASPTVQAAATAPHWREVYTCVPIGDRLLEGYIDLLYRGDDGLVVVDHKTAATTDPAELDRRLLGYRRQGAAYALTVGRATGESVVRVVFVFLTPQGAIERELPDLEGAMAEIGPLVEG
jgi:hypothetical protein